jgi:hypothetical protein
MASTDPRTTASVPAARARCPNCAAATHGHYCANCGQETAITLPGFRAFMRDAAGRYVALDGRLWRTLYALIARPGFLTLEYFAGRRRRYIRPARLFLVLYLLLFAVIGLVQSPADMADQVVFVQENEAAGQAVKAAVDATKDAATEVAKDLAKDLAKEPAKDSPRDIARKAAKAEAAARNNAAAKGNGAPAAAGTDAARPKGVFSDDKDTLIGLDDELNITFRINGAEAQLPEFFRKRYEHFRQLPREEKAERLYSGALRYGSYAMIALLPVFALLLKLVYLGSGERHPGRPRLYAEHLVYSAHLHAFAALVLLLFVIMPDWGPVKAALAVWVVYYIFRARGAVYKGRWWAGLLRSLVVAVIYFILVSVAIAGLLAVAALVR